MYKQAHRRTAASPAQSKKLASLCTLFLLPAFGSLSAQTPAPAEPASAAVANTQPLAAPLLFATTETPATPFSSSLTPEPTLPDAPVPQVRSANAPPPPGSPENHGVAPIHALVIPPNLRAQPMTAGDKVKATARDLYSLTNIAGIFLSAGYSHVTDGQPNYGTNSAAFGKRLGAAAVRDTNEEIFASMILDPLLHEDPRYYIKGPGHGFINRTWYAATRTLVTRTDDGRSTVNAAMLLGYAGAIAITPTYYPAINRNAKDAAASYGGSLGGSALGFFVSEFSDDVLRAVHLKRAP